MGLTKAQDKAVHCSGKPLFIQAGAGTGKTFTLTKRLAYGLSQESGPLICDVDNLLTITFTNKAAAELLGRVRAELRRCGLADAALKVDGAWISTIHSMCQRVLTAHAFDAGIDPGAQLMSEEESNELLGMALDEVLAQGTSEKDLALLHAAFSVQDMAQLILGVAGILEGSPNQEEAFSLGPEPKPVADAVLLGLHGRLSALVFEIDQAGAEAGSATVVKCAGLVRDCKDAVQQALAGAGADGVSWLDAARALEDAKLTKYGRLKAEPWPALFDDYNEQVQAARAEVSASVQYVMLAALSNVARAVVERHAALKRARGAIDMGDILVKTARLLASRPDIARQYRERFASVMIDEFQDTDALQVDIVRNICDEALSTLVTVGDAQQSIYGFRGADLEVYRETHRLMQTCGCDEVELKTNFRSHSGVLGFVETVFCRPEFFGGEFLQVAPGPCNDCDQPWANAADPRVGVLFATGVEGEKKAPLADALRDANAVQIADAFEAFHAKGAPYSSMAILLRSMKALDIYASHLRQRGIPYTVSGGSAFYQQPEVKLISMLLRFLENCDDDEALFNVLGSALFDLRDDDLLALSGVQNDVLKLQAPHMRRRASLFDALCYRAENPPGGQDDLCARACTVLRAALGCVGSAPLSGIVLDVVRESGWLARLQRDELSGASVMANIQRLCDALDESEQRYGRSVLRQAEHVRLMCQLAEEGLGARAKSGTMVRSKTSGVQIMTIHASKGLEFPIVAVAEWNTKYDAPGASRLLTFTENSKSYLAMSVKKTGNELLFSEDAAAPSFAGAADQTSYLARALQEATQREAAESQRLLYVALTRARDNLLLVGYDGAYANKKALGAGLQSETLQAVFGEELPHDGAVVKTQTGALVEFHSVSVSRPQTGDPGDSDASSRDRAPDARQRLHYLTPLGQKPQLDVQVASDPLVYSYSMLKRMRDADGRSDELLAQKVQLRDRSRDRQSEPGAQADHDATPLGSAFHQVAEWLVRVRADATQAQVSERIGSAARRYGLDELQRHRLAAAVEAWVASSLFMRACGYPRIEAEYPFCVEVDGRALEGSIDLLCLNADARDALIVDYKTGTSGKGDIDRLKRQYALQAQCYSYAVLSSGLTDHVEMVFARPEAGMEEVVFEFSVEDLATLRSSIFAH